MKIIRISTVPGSLYTFVRQQIVELKKEYDVVAVSSPGPKLKLLGEECGIRVVEVPMERHISILSDIKSLYQLIVVFIKERPDAIHSMTPKAGLLSMLAGKITGVPVRVHTFTGLVFPTSYGLKRKILMLTDKITCACATYINPEGFGVKKDLERFNITKKPLCVIANGNVRGVDMKWYSRTEQVVLKAKDLRVEDKVTFCFIGRIVKDKGINELVWAFSQLNKEYNNTRLILIGVLEDKLDPIKPEIYSEIMNNKSINYVGPQNDVRPWLAASDIYVFPSYREGMPNSLLEAGAMGLPSIVTNINGNNEIIVDGENGEIIPARNQDALYNKMREWVNNKEKVSRMAGNARRMIGERYSQDIVLAETIKVYHELIHN